MKRVYVNFVVVLFMLILQRRLCFETESENEDNDEDRHRMESDVCPHNEDFKCVTSGQCIPSMGRCDGHRDCQDNSDETGCVSGRCQIDRTKLKNGRIKIRSRGRIAKFVCDPGYELAGKRFATCVNGRWNNPMPVCVARGCYRQRPVPNGHITEMYRGAMLAFTCNPGYTLEGSESLFCDGRRWNSSAPECIVAVPEPEKSCDFENRNLCGWSHDPHNDFDWKRNQFTTPSGHVGTGPSYDHTFGMGKGGFYLYMEASAPRKVNDTTRLFSPVYPADYSDSCFTFWYHMYGAATGGLRVYLKPERQLFGELLPVWEKWGDQGNQWMRGHIAIEQLQENFQIVMEGVRGTGYVGDTAIDDIDLTKGACEDVENTNDSVSHTEAESCRGRCSENDEVASCGCNEDCIEKDNCCSDFTTVCSTGNDTANENLDEPLPDNEIGKTPSLVTETITELYLTESTKEATKVSELSTSLEMDSSSSKYVTAAATTSSSSSTTIASTDSSITLSLLQTTTSLPPASTTTPLFVSSTTAPLSIPSTTNQSSVSSTPLISTPFSVPLTLTTLITPKTTTTNLPITKTDAIVLETRSVIFNMNQDIVTTTASDTIGDTNPSTELISQGTSVLTTAAITVKEIEKISPITFQTPIRSTASPTTFKSASTPLPTILISYSSEQNVSPNTNIVSNVATSPALSSTTSSMSEGTSISMTPSTRKIYNLRPRTRTTSSVTDLIRSTPIYTSTSIITSYQASRETIAIFDSTLPVTLNSVPNHRHDNYDSLFYTPRLRIVTPTTSKTNTPTISTKPNLEVITHTKSTLETTVKNKFKDTQVFTTELSKKITTESSLLHASKEASTASNAGLPTVTIAMISVVVVICAAGGLLYYMRKQKSKRQSKLSDDSEMRFLSENEISEYSDASVLDKILIK